MDPKKPPSLFPLEKCPQVSDEAFYIFHSIDREFFTRLVHNFGREPALSMQVVAFFMWLEKQSKDMFLIKRMLTLPPFLLNELVEEAVICLRCAESDSYPLGDSNDGVVSLLPDIMGNRIVTARYFHENRVAVLRGVSKIVDTVCVRAFQDILQRLQADMVPGGMVPPGQFAGGSNEVVGESSRMAAERNEIGGGFGAGEMGPLGRLPLPPGLMYNPYLVAPFGQLPSPTGLGPMIRMPLPPQMAVPPHVPLAPAVEHVNGIPLSMLMPGGFPVFDLEVQRQMLGNELMQMLEQNMVINNNREEIRNVNYGEQVEEEQVAAEEVPADDRTIFLTFSKGYPISEQEVLDYFTKRFGDFIEELIMQEVDEGEQVLYARMVVRPQLTAVINGIVGRSRAKYSINGKHVWSRKYVKKPQASTTRSSPPRATEGSSSRRASTSRSSPPTATEGLSLRQASTSRTAPPRVTEGSSSQQASTSTTAPPRVNEGSSSRQTSGPAPEEQS